MGKRAPILVVDLHSYFMDQQVKNNFFQYETMQIIVQYISGPGGVRIGDLLLSQLRGPALGLGHTLGILSCLEVVIVEHPVHLQHDKVCFHNIYKHITIPAAK